MEPTTRNRGLMIGGGILLVVLALMCGPLEGKFGTGAEQKTPDVAAGPPPAGIGAAAGAAAAGAAVGAAIGESGIAGIIDERDAAAATSEAYEASEGAASGAVSGDVDGATRGLASVRDAASGAAASMGAAVSSGVGAASGIASAASAASGSAIGAGAGAAAAGASAAGIGAASAVKAAGGSVSGRLPAVSAGPDASPIRVAAAPSGPSSKELAAAAANQFDHAVAGIATGGVGAAGKVVDRFAPPVEGGPVNSPLMAQADAFAAGVLRPCDSPGAGCQNVSSAIGAAGNLGYDAVSPPGR